jgi:hypothetical protein
VSLQRVACWAGMGKGTVTVSTQHVMTAVLGPDFMHNAVRFLTAEENEQAKAWVGEHLCKAWQNGWCLVDGTLVPLFAWPYWFGESYFDWKCCYSPNMQARHPFCLHLNFTDKCNAQTVSLPNLHIIDFSYSHTGSTHDSTAWEETWVACEHEQHLEDGEWVCADSAYPVCLLIIHTFSLHDNFASQISEWVVAPYKKPECDMPDNEIINNHVSMVQIWSEHAIGFLKGQFASLKDLHINISNKKSHWFATYWIASCVGLHTFAMMCEDDEHPHDQNTTDRWDPFIDEGLSSSSDSDNNRLAAPCLRSS